VRVVRAAVGSVVTAVVVCPTRELAATLALYREMGWAVRERRGGVDGEGRYYAIRTDYVRVVFTCGED
jgi:hypothetical protein